VESSLKAMGKDGHKFSHLRNQFLRINEAKNKNGISGNPQIRNVLDKSTNEATLNLTDIAAMNPLSSLLISWAIAKQTNCGRIVKKYWISSKYRTK
jgi:hypothetical protein